MHRISRPSGEYEPLVLSPGRPETRKGRPAVDEVTNNRGPVPPRYEVKRMSEPSGDHAGERAMDWSAVSGASRAPS